MTPRAQGLAVAGVAALVAVAWVWALRDASSGRSTAGGGVAVRSASPKAPARSAARQRGALAARSAPAAPDDEAFGRLNAQIDDGSAGGAVPAGDDAPRAAKGPMGGHAAPRDVAALEVDPATLSIVQELARADGACAAGQAGACARLDRHGQDGRRQLRVTEAKLALACKGHQFVACRWRGDLALRRRRLDEATTWLAQARTLATNVRSRCAAGQERQDGRCAEAESTLTVVRQQEAEIAASRR